VATVLGVKDSSGGDPLEALIRHLEDKKVLLILDNFEHVVDAAGSVGRLLAETTGTHVLVTSRSLLRIRGETVFDLPPMASPPSGSGIDPSDLGAYDGVRLLVQRSRAVAGSLTLDDANAGPIARIVRRLDGLPLALELAAARSRHFSPDELADRLDRDFEPIAGALVDLPDRQLTVNAMVRWSYDLLTPEEQAALRQFAVFAGSFDAEAAEAVLVGEMPAGEAIRRLMENSLLTLRPVVGQDRFSMLQTIREVALLLPPASGTESAAADRHADHFAQVGLGAEPELDGVAQKVWIERLGHDRDNFRAALAHSTAGGDPDTGARLAAALWRFWQATGLLVEGASWLTRLLQLEGIRPRTRPKALEALAGLAYWRADFDEALRCYRTALDIRRDLGDRAGQAETLYGMSLTAALSGDLDLATSLSDESKAIALDLGDRAQYGRALRSEATVFWFRGDLKSARRVWEESLAISLEQGNTAFAATQMVGLSALIFQDGDVHAALAQAGEALRTAVDNQNAHIQVFALDAIASYAVQRSPAEAVALAAASDAARQIHGGGWTVESVGISPARETGGDALTESQIDAAWENGRTFGLDDAVTEGFNLVSALTSQANS
jgi:predicted ATPase